MLAVIAIAMGSACSSDQVPFTVVAAGDLACDPADHRFNGGEGNSEGCRAKATAILASEQEPNAVLVLGDTQYETGAYASFLASYDGTWGRFLDITHPVPGNHEYFTAGAQGYFDYFGESAGDAARGYYTRRLGDWTLIALNSNCEHVGGCGEGSGQLAWLRHVLATDTRRCTVAMMHHPRFSSGVHGATNDVVPLWNALKAGGVDVLLSGHDHTYERFTPEGPLRQFVVGTGGKGLYEFVDVLATSEARFNGSLGVLRLDLVATGYAWQFITEHGDTIDRGTGACQ